MTKVKRLLTCLFLTLCLLFVNGCSKSSPSGSTTAVSSWDNTPKVLTPVATGTTILGNETISIDASNTSEGYIMVMYTGTASKLKFFVTTPDGIAYNYDLLPSSDYSAIPLTGGDGSYTIEAKENVMDNLYSLLYSNTLSVAITNEFSPFLYPNQYTWFTVSSKAVAKASELTEKATDTISAIECIYNYVIANVKYDEEKAGSVTSTYLPNVDTTLSTGKGICFDFAAIMTAMLRSQGIPAKLEIGYSGQVYHAWISAYAKETGWISNVIHFDGSSWSLMDPTLAAANGSQSVKNYVGDGSNYTVKYSR